MSEILQNEEEFNKSLNGAFQSFLANLKIKNDSQFNDELEKMKTYLFSLNRYSEAIEAIKNRFTLIYNIVMKNETMCFKQEGYSKIRPFTDNYQEAIDFFATEYGERVKQVFYYFAYKYKVPEDQLGGCNIDENFTDGSNL